MIAVALVVGLLSSEVYAIRGARIVTLAGEPIEKGTVVIRDGRISDVGADVAIPAGAQVIEAEGLELYPGIMDAVSQLGLTEVGATAATVDVRELGEFNPQIRAVTAIHPASEHIAVARANGITHVVSAPEGRFGFQGQASLVNLDGWTVEEMTIAPFVGTMLFWPTLDTVSFDLETFERMERKYSEVKKEYDERVARLGEWMEAARRYTRALAEGAGDLEKDLKLEALGPVVRREVPLLVVADDERNIRAAVEFASVEDVRMVLLSGRDSWKVKDLLREKGIPVVLGPTLALPTTEDEPYDKPLTTASELQSAGVRVIFASFSSANSRLLPHEVGNAVAYGLPWEEGLKAITLYPAELFGVADSLGTIEEGKTANLIVTTGDPLEIRTEVRYLFIQGKLTPLDNKHQRLYERYRARP
ncbi:MAG: amidohydrolase family protein [Vicinamibacteria bacterium]